MNDLTIGDEVLVAIPTGWAAATITGFRTDPHPENDWQRVDVLLHDGRRIQGCHPHCVKPKETDA